MPYEGKNMEMFANPTEYEKTIYGKIRYINNKVEVPKGGECSIPVVVANEYNIKVGGKIVLSSGSKSYSYVKTKISDLSSLRKLNKLRFLRLDINEIRDISALRDILVLANITY